MKIHIMKYAIWRCIYETDSENTPKKNHGIGRSTMKNRSLEACCRIESILTFTQSLLYMRDPN